LSQTERNTFELIDVNFGRDRRFVYGFLGEVIDNADPGSFRRIGESLFYCDNRGVYYTGYPSGWVDGADSTSFAVGPGHDEGHDSVWLYKCNHKKGPRNDWTC